MQVHAVFGNYIRHAFMHLLYSYSYEGMLNKSAACARRNRVVACNIAICKCYAFVLFIYTHVDDGTLLSILCNAYV